MFNGDLNDESDGSRLGYGENPPAIGCDFFEGPYQDGDGVKQSHGQASLWFRLAADQGDADAQFALGCAYEDGEGVQQDHAEAVKWYRLAADQGDVDGKLAIS